METEALKSLSKKLINSFSSEFTVLLTGFTYAITHKCQVVSGFSSGTESSGTVAVFLLLFIVSVKYLLEGLETCACLVCKT